MVFVNFYVSFHKHSIFKIMYEKELFMNRLLHPFYLRFFYLLLLSYLIIPQRKIDITFKNILMSYSRKRQQFSSTKIIVFGDISSLKVLCNNSCSFLKLFLKPRIFMHIKQSLIFNMECTATPIIFYRITRYSEIFRLVHH